MAGQNTAKTSHKHALIDKANQVAIIALSAAVAILIFSLFATYTLIKQNMYNQRVIGEKKTALKQAKQNRANVNELMKTYTAFASEPVNVLGGNPAGTGPKDGDNPRIILDALPSQYDFPGFVSSMEKLIQTQGGLTIENLGGSDGGDSGTSTEESTAAVVPVEMTMPVSVTSDFAKIQAFVKVLEASIRPIYITTLSLGGDDSSMQLQLDLKTFYQPEKSFNVTTKVVQ